MHKSENCTRVKAKGFLPLRFDRLLLPSHIRSALEGCGREEAPGRNRQGKGATERRTRPAKACLSCSGLPECGTVAPGGTNFSAADAKLDANSPVVVIVPHRTATRHTSTVIYELVSAAHTEAIGSQLESQVGVKLVKLQCGNDTMCPLGTRTRRGPPFVLRHDRAYVQVRFTFSFSLPFCGSNLSLDLARGIAIVPTRPNRRLFTSLSSA